MRESEEHRKKTKRKRLLCTVISENVKLHDNYKDNTVLTLYDRANFLQDV